MEERENVGALLELYKTEVIAAFSTFFFVSLIFFGGVMASGVLLGLISTIGFSILFYESRTAMPKLYGWMVRNPFWTDLISTILLTGMFGTSVNGLVAAAVFGVLNTVFLMVVNKYDPRAKESGETDSFGDQLKDYFKNRSASEEEKVENAVEIESERVVA